MYIAIIYIIIYNAGGRRDRLRAFLGVLAARWLPVLSRGGAGAGRASWRRLARAADDLRCRAWLIWRASGIKAGGRRDRRRDLASSAGISSGRRRRPVGAFSASGPACLRPCDFCRADRRRLLPIRFFGARLFRLGQFFRAGRFSSFFDFPRALSVPQDFSGGFSVPFDFSGAKFSPSVFPFHICLFLCFHISTKKRKRCFSFIF